MTYTKEQGKQKIKELVERFQYNLDVYKRSTYNETQVRREFIDPFFEALGWDVSNKQGYAEQYKDVVHEDAIKVGHSTRAPDYSFRIGGQRKFFVEAKKPAVNIKEDVHPSYQLRRYAWSAKLPLSIVTDFEEFSVFNCQMKPNPTDKPGLGRFAYYTFDVYLDKFDEIYDVFSKEAVLKGSFDRYAQSTKGKKGTATVDSEFLREIESWRELLAKNIALRNPNVSIYELNYSVQKIIDRIIFLRICEDRGIEHYGQLQTKAESGDVYMHLLNHFRLAESKYNSGIFDFDSDGITPALTIDDKVLKAIIQDLYYPKSPYEFSVLGVEILGNVYEQFLGKVIRLTAGHQAKVETKPEVKKAGGVYYTPQYIVEYIVKNTVGKLVEGKTPEQIAAIKILDPACGSGSFLIGAYSYLLRYHLDWYVSNKPKKHKEAVFQVKENEWYLTTAEKKRILLDNIFGVDIDSQAVEVTKMSLLLKVLEHESRESIDQQMKLGLEGVLPNLGDNIKCGNSLIGPEYYEQQQETLFDEAEMRRVNVFDWEDERKGFGGIMQRGGFDCVIGNPPYVRIQRLSHDEIDYFFENFEAAKKKVDISVLFIEKSLKLLNENGLAGFISTSQWISTDYGEGLRNILSEGYLENMIDFGSLPVFHKVSTYPAIFILSNKGKKHLNYIKIQKKDLLNLKGIESTKPKKLFYKMLSHDRWILGEFDLNRWIEKKNIMSEKLGTYGHFYIGALTGMDKVFVLKADDAEKYRLEKDILIPYAYRGEEIKRYNEVSPKSVIIYPYKDGEGGNAVLMQESELKKYKNVYQYLLKNKGELMRRKDSRKEYARGRNWYRFLRPGRFTYIKPEKLIIKGVAKDACVGLLEKNIAFNGANCPAFIIDRGNIYYLIGLLNSKLITQYLRSVCPAKLQRYRRFNANNLNKIPIRTINFDDPAEKAQRDKLVSLVDNMLELQKKYHETRMEQDKELYERQIKLVDAQIDGLVYDLYGLTEEEIEVVEGEK